MKTIINILINIIILIAGRYISTILFVLFIGSGAVMNKYKDIVYLVPYLIHVFILILIFLKSRFKNKVKTDKHIVAICISIAYILIQFYLKQYR